MDPQQIVFLVILGTALALFISGRLRVDVVAMLTLLALALTGILDAKQALEAITRTSGAAPRAGEGSSLSRNSRAMACWTSCEAPAISSR